MKSNNTETCSTFFLSPVDGTALIFPNFLLSPLDGTVSIFPLNTMTTSTTLSGLQNLQFLMNRTEQTAINMHPTHNESPERIHTFIPNIAPPWLTGHLRRGVLLHVLPHDPLLDRPELLVLARQHLATSGPSPNLKKRPSCHFNRTNHCRTFRPPYQRAAGILIKRDERMQCHRARHQRRQQQQQKTRC